MKEFLLACMYVESSLESLRTCAGEEVETLLLLLFELSVHVVMVKIFIVLKAYCNCIL